MAFYVLSALPGGYLTDRYSRVVAKASEGGGKIEEGSHFDEKTRQGKSYRQRHWNESMFAALDLIRSVAGKHNLTEVESALRWLMHQIGLDVGSGDKVIIEASSEKHLDKNWLDFEKGSLPDDVVQAPDELWGMAKGVACSYYH
jgi:aflatoxin B1 aldehyde reductase